MSNPDITGVILAGGRGSRMGARNKGLLTLGGKPLIAHVIARLSPQLTDIVISANDDIDDYRRFGLPIVADTLPEYPGPLAGLYSVLQQVQSTWLLSVPCDTPALPTDYVARMRRAVVDYPAAVVHDGQRVQPGFCLLHRSLLPKLEAALRQGHYAVYRFLAEIGAREVDFSEQPASFTNLNTLEQLQAYDRQFLPSLADKPHD